MAIHYSVSAHLNPRDPEGDKIYYAKAQAVGTVTINELAEDISYSTTLTDGDVLNVIRALIKQINKHIERGEIVKLENLGTFQLQISSKSALTEEEFTQDCIRNVKLQFRPGVGLQKTLSLNNLSFKRVKTLTEVAETEEVPGV
jgi:predicted histone-like DNA-binding protein|nr:MAG TPA: DNA-binding protein [Caudoviricetes sp.]